jgi:hypothetical protein
VAADYHLGTASNPTDLLQGIVSWLVAQGWTSHLSAADGSGWRAHLHKTVAGQTLYANFRSAINETIFPSVQANPAYGIGLYGSTSYDGGVAWHLQPGRSISYGYSYTVGCGIMLPSGAVLNWRGFDDGADNVVIVVEVAGAVFGHLGLGLSLNKAGTYTGGQYVFGSRSAHLLTSTSVMGSLGSTAGCPFSSLMALDFSYHQNDSSVGFVYAAVDGVTDWIGVPRMDANYWNGFTGRYSETGLSYINKDGAGGADSWDIPTYARISRWLVSDINEAAVLLPIRIYVQRSGGGFSLLGTVPSVFVSSAVGQGFVAAAVYSLAAKDYMLFPNFAVRKAA